MRDLNPTVDRLQRDLKSTRKITRGPSTRKLGHPGRPSCDPAFLTARSASQLTSYLRPLQAPTVLSRLRPLEHFGVA